MSGTSMDGIDAALLETDGSFNSIHDLGHTTIDYDSESKMLFKSAEYSIRKFQGNMREAKAAYLESLREYLQNELKLSNPDNTIKSLTANLHGNEDTPLRLDDVILHSTKLHVEIVRKLLSETGRKASEIDVVGYHGQAMYHQPSRKISIIVGDGQYLADQVGIVVVNDFRSQDVASGGQGAPFAPLYHHALAVRDHKTPTAIVNCGGIANVTFVPSADEHDLIAFDTGPGNGLIDKLIRQRTNGQECMDKDGQYGEKGKVHEDALKALYERSVTKDGENYLLMPPPKSLDIGDMSLVPELDSLSLEDACATLEEFTAATIVDSLNWFKGTLPQEWILAGGGWKNPVIRQSLERNLQIKLNKKVTIQTADEAGWNGQAMEAQIFAYLAVRSLQGKPLSMPNTTRVPEPMLGGMVCRPLKLLF
jgi:anhydro-N-acetylmuramic acid kinase